MTRLLSTRCPIMYPNIINAQNGSGKGKLAKAVHYALNEKKYLYTFLDDGNVPIDNNRAENAICPFAVGRKN